MIAAAILFSCKASTLNLQFPLRHNDTTQIRAIMPAQTRKAQDALDQDTYTLVLDYLVGHRTHWLAKYGTVMEQLNGRCMGRCSDCCDLADLPVGSAGWCQYCS